MKENRFKTKDLQAAEGFYLAEDVKRSWTEDFVDEDKGEVVPVVRYELVMERGTYLDPDAISNLEFHKQTGDIDEIEVTDIQRTAKDVDEVRELVEEWVRDYSVRERQRLEEQDSKELDAYKRLAGDFDLSVKSAAKIPCTATVPMELSKDYYESLEEGAEK